MTKDTFGKRFKALRQEKKLTQEKIAQIFYLNTSSISKYEKDKSLPENALLIQMSDFFDVSVDYLLCCTDIRKRINPIKDGPLWIDTESRCHPIHAEEQVILQACSKLPDDRKKEILNRILSELS